MNEIRNLEKFQTRGAHTRDLSSLTWRSSIMGVGLGMLDPVSGSIVFNTVATNLHNNLVARMILAITVLAMRVRIIVHI